VDIIRSFISGSDNFRFVVGGDFVLEGRLREITCFTYLIQCADGSLYCGWTNDLEKRVKAHNAGHGAKYTRSRRPVKLVYYETFATKQEAMRREWEIKQLRRAEKLDLINGNKKYAQPPVASSEQVST
jgi:putative endonuclease